MSFLFHQARVDLNGQPATIVQLEKGWVSIKDRAGLHLPVGWGTSSIEGALRVDDREQAELIAASLLDYVDDGGELSDTLADNECDLSLRDVMQVARDVNELADLLQRVGDVL